MFIPVLDGRPASGVTDAHGNYRLKTFEADDGAILGKHAVTIAKQKQIGARALSNGTPGPVTLEGMRIDWLTPEHYSVPDKSALRATVAEGKNEINFKLVSRSKDE